MENNETYWEPIDGKIKGYVVHCGTKSYEEAVGELDKLLPQYRKGAKVEWLPVKYKDGHVGNRFLVLVPENN